MLRRLRVVAGFIRLLPDQEPAGNMVSVVRSAR